jgi:hypothetical protein
MVKPPRDPTRLVEKKSLPEKVVVQALPETLYKLSHKSLQSRPSRPRPAAVERVVNVVRRVISHP